MIRKIGLSVLLALALPIGAWAAPPLQEQLGAPSLQQQLQRQQRELNLRVNPGALPTLHEQFGAPSLQQQLQRQEQNQLRFEHQLPPEQ